MSRITKLLTMLLASTAIMASSGAWAEDIAIVGGQLVTVVPGAEPEIGTVLIHDGMIEAVGDVDVPDGYRVVDATGQIVTRGLMNPSSSLGLDVIRLEGATVDREINGGRFSNATTVAPFNAAFDVSYAYDPRAPHIAIARMEGVTRAALIPSSGQNLFGGIGAVVDLSGALDTEVLSGTSMSVTLGSPGAAHAGGSRAGAMVYLIGALEEATRLAARGEAGMPPRERDTLVSNIDAEALIPVVQGTMPMLVNVSRAIDILQVIALLDQFEDLDIVIVDGTEAWEVADQLAAANIPVIVDATNNLPSFNGYAATLYNATRLTEAGVEVSFVGPGFNRNGNSRLVTQAAGIAVAHGMDWNDAVAALTINPARIYGLEDRIGTLEPGKDADVVIWDGDPLEVMSAPTAVFIMGEEIELTSRQTELRDRYMDLNDMEMPLAYKH